jgi:predicted PurR-regulated permease PerM
VGQVFLSAAENGGDTADRNVCPTEQHVEILPRVVRDAGEPGSGGTTVARIVSFVVLLVILVVIGGLFVRVMAGFLLPLFLALLLVVMFGPLHRWFLAKCGRYSRVAAMLTTVSILALVLIPLLFLLAAAAGEAQSIYSTAMGGPALSDADPSAEAAKPPPNTPDLMKLIDRGADEIIKLSEWFGNPLNRAELEASLKTAAQQFLTPLALRTTQFVGQALMGLLVMILGVYYFFADGPVMIQTLLRLSPLEPGRTRELIDQFDSVTRAVVSATLVSAFVQGLLIGAGFYVAGVGSVFLLTALAMLFTLVPFVGSALVYVPVCLWQFGVAERPVAAAVLAAYCLAIAVTIDNVVKPLMLHGRSNLHPLLALLSVLGGVSALGPIGILVGPMVVAFLQTLLNMVHSELKNMTSAPEATSLTAPMKSAL